jgi:hypothetical protein
MSKELLTDVDAIAKAINFPKENWAGNCHAVSYQIVEAGLVEGNVERGHYYGKIAKGSIFNEGLVPHSWIRLSNGLIYDPTRFAFEVVEPYIHVSENDSEYDLGGTKLREAMLTPLKEFDETKPKIELEFKTKECEDFVMALVNHPPHLTVNEGFYLANFPFPRLGAYAKEIYQALEDADCGAFIPLDSWEYVMETHHKK